MYCMYRRISIIEQLITCRPFQWMHGLQGLLFTLKNLDHIDPGTLRSKDTFIQIEEHH